MSDLNRNTFTLGELTLVDGLGDYAEATACVMSAAAAYHAMENGEPLEEPTDELQCCCPVLRSLVIRRNDGDWQEEYDDDWEGELGHDDSNERRSRWGRKIIPRLINSKVSPAETNQRGYRWADVAVRKIAPIRLRANRKSSLADMLESIPVISDEKSARAAQEFVESMMARAIVAYDAARFLSRTQADPCKTLISAAYRARISQAALQAASAHIKVVTSTIRDSEAFGSTTGPEVDYHNATYVPADNTAAAEHPHIDALIEEFLAPPRKDVNKVFNTAITLTHS